MQSLPNSSNDTYVVGAYTATGVANVFHDPSQNLKYQFSLNQTPYKANMSCSTGAMSINNTCLCPGSASGVPYRQSNGLYQQTAIHSLFTPSEPMVQPTQAARTLIAQRSPASGSYSDMDLKPYTQSHYSQC